MRQHLREERRQRIGNAVLRIAARDGLEAVSLRSVAHETAGSMGQIQYQFGSVADLRLYSTKLAIAGIEDALAPARRATGQDRIVLSARALLADDPSLIRTLRALAQLRAGAASDPRIADVLGQLHSTQCAELTDVIATAKAKGLLHRLVEPSAAADAMWTLMLAVAIDVANGTRQRDDGLTVLRYAFRAMGRRRTHRRGRRAPTSGRSGATAGRDPT